MAKKKTKCACPKCKGTNIGQDAWADPNSGGVISWFDNFHCFDCEEDMRHVIDIEVEEKADE